ncbi:WW domain-containing protein [Pleurotus pulmonarius]
MGPFLWNRCSETRESSRTVIKSNACDAPWADVVASQDVPALPQATQTNLDLEAGPCPNDAPPVPTSAHPTADLPLPSPQLGDQTADSPTTEYNPPMLCRSHPEFLPIPPRYFKRSETVPPVCHDIKIPPLSTGMTNTAPVGWTRYEHPKGPLYFRHESKNIFSNAHLGASANLATISRFIASFESFVSDNRIHIDPSSELVLDLREPDKNTERCGYYLVDHQDRTVFWLDEFNTADLPDWQDVPGVTANAHIRHELEALYWRHCEFFPHTREVTQDLVDELRDMITHALGDISSYPLSIIEFTTDELKTMLDIVAAAETQVKKLAPASFATLSRLMHLRGFGSLYLTYQPSARSARGQAIYDSSTKRSYFYMLSKLLYFGGPEAYMRVLHGAYVDRMVNAAHVNQVVSRLIAEWKDFILVATVLLNANVALLAIQTWSIGSIIIGLLLVRQTRSNGPASPMRLLRRRPFSLQLMAFTYSLPGNLLMMSILAFLLSFGFLCFDSDAFTCLVVGIPCLCVTFDIVSYLWRCREIQPVARPNPPKEVATFDQQQAVDRGKQYVGALRGRFWKWITFSWLKKGSVNSEATSV